MFKRLLTRLSLIAVLLGLTACATVPEGATPYPVQYPDLSTSSSITNKVSLGSMISVPSGAGIDGEQGRVVDEYFSASGRHCRRVEITPSDSSTRVMCQRESGEWSFTRSLINDRIPSASDELLITTPLEQNESNSAERSKVDQSSTTEKSGNVFDTHYTVLTSFDGASVWDFTGTSTAGPASWARLALASDTNALSLIDIDEPIAGRR